jgi:hypothetical protein
MRYLSIYWGATAVITAWVLMRILPISRASANEARWTYYSLLVTAGFESVFIFLMSAFAGLWGGELFPILVPMLLLPAFLLLTYGNIGQLSFISWFLTVASSIAFYAGMLMDNAVSPHPLQNARVVDLGYLFNPFTQFVALASVLLQLAAFCRKRIGSVAESSDELHSQPAKTLL